MEKFINEKKQLINSITLENIEENYDIISKNINLVLENIISRLEKTDIKTSFVFLDTFRNIQDNNDCIELESIKNYYNDILNLLILKYGKDIDLLS